MLDYSYCQQTEPFYLCRNRRSVTANNRVKPEYSQLLQANKKAPAAMISSGGSSAVPSR